jgi:hypothetical protein
VAVGVGGLLLVPSLPIAVGYGLYRSERSVGAADFAPLVLFGALYLALVAFCLYTIRAAVDRVVITADALRVKPGIGREWTLRWDQVANVNEFTKHTTSGRLRVMRIVATSGRTVRITSLLPRYDDLATEIRTRTAHLPRGADATFWERQF